MLSEINLPDYVYTMMKQLYLFIESVLIKTNYKNYNLCLSKLIQAIKITAPNFNISNYNTFVYNELEVKILMNIALALNHVESKEKGLEILQFCLDAADSNNDFKIKILYNLSYNYYRLDLYDNSLFYADLGIDVCMRNNTFSCLDLLYSRKGIAEYYLGQENYMQSLSKALFLYDLIGNKAVKDLFITSCKNIHNINLPKD